MNDFDFCKQLQKGLLSEIHKCKTNYATLVKMSDEINAEIAKCQEHFITCFIEYELLEESVQNTNTLTTEIMTKYDSFFKAGEETDWAPYSTGFFKYNFGDVVLDNKSSTKGIVVGETRVYISIWYYTSNENDMLVKQRKKDDSMLEVLRSCTLE